MAVSLSDIIKLILFMALALFWLWTFDGKLSAHIDETKKQITVLRQICRNTAKTEYAMSVCEQAEN